MFTLPTVVTSCDLKKRSYVTFYFNGERIREYNGSNLDMSISPNRAKSLTQRNESLEKLRYELHKALEASVYPIKSQQIAPATDSICNITTEINLSMQSLLLEALNGKLNSSISRTYKRDLTDIHRQFVEFMLPEELEGPIGNIQTARIEKFLARYGSSGTYYMNKRRNLGVLFNAAGRLIDKPLKAVKATERRRTKARLHEKYERSQLKPILGFLQKRYPNLYLCCLLTYSAWLRPHEEVRLLTLNNFKNDLSEVHLTGGDNKGGQVRVVYIPEYVRKELRPILSKLTRDDNIFTLTPQPFNEYYFNTQWSRAWEQMYKLGLVFENQTIYSFRHTAAVATYRKTKDVHLLQKLLGHSSIVVTLKYLRTLGELNTDELKAAAPQLD